MVTPEPIAPNGLAGCAPPSLAPVLPLAMAIVAPAGGSPAIALASLIALFALGALSASIGGAPVTPAALRVTFWGALAMALTAGAGWLFGAAV